MIYHVGHYQRHLELLPKVTDVGFLFNKNEPVKKIFKSCNFSFILKGDGWYYFKGEKLKVTAPAILLQWPGEPMFYGPDTVWDEYFFIYSDRSFNILNSAGLLNTNNPVFPLKGVIDTVSLLNNILDLIQSKPAVFPADRLDMLCFRTISETHIFGDEDHLQSKNEKNILLIAGKIKSAPLKLYDFKKISEDLGMSFPSFRRYWQRYIGVSPGRYISDLKLSIACKLLVESEKSIGEVSNSINFDDTLYFSRFFKKKTGLTPREYRHNHQLKIF